MWVVAVPVAFLVGLLRERLAFAVVGELVSELSRVGPDQVQPGLARCWPIPTCGCCSLSTGMSNFVDVDGHRVDPPVAGGTRAVTPLGDGLTPLAVLVHDPVLLWYGRRARVAPQGVAFGSGLPAQ